MPESTIQHLRKAVELQKKIIDKPKPDRRVLEEEAEQTKKTGSK